MIGAELRAQYRDAAARAAAEAPEVTPDSDVAHELRSLFSGFPAFVEDRRTARPLEHVADRDAA